MKKITNALLVGGLCAALNLGHAAELLPETDQAFHERMQWFTDAQFGLFIHYGVYATLGGEWKGQTVEKYAEWIQHWGNISSEEYVPLAAGFRPDKLDADRWVKTAREAGMKYLVITTKHHDGFCLWNSAYTDYDLGGRNKFSRDILGELAAACKKYGLKFGTYYSIIDWHHPSQGHVTGFQPPMKDKPGYVAYMKGQLKELIDRYHPAIMWFDGDWVDWWTMDDGIDLYNYLRTLDPHLIINNRVAKRKEFKKDYGTPENSTPGEALDHIWEACWTVNHSWGYKKSDTTWKPIDVLVQQQIDINTKGGNLLLNVGPYADGSWPETSTSLLREMGAWNSAHREAVYGTDYIEAPEQTWGRLARSRTANEKSGELFAYLFQWPQTGKLLIKGVSAGHMEAFTYAGRPLATTVTGDDVEIDLAAAAAGPWATVLRLKYHGGIKTLKESNTIELRGNELILQGNEAKLSGLNLKDNLLVSEWSDASDEASWLLNVPAPGKYAVKILYSYDANQAGRARLMIGDQALTSGIIPTGSQTRFKLADAGTIVLNQVGAIPCKIMFGEQKWNERLSLKTIYFVPVAD